MRPHTSGDACGEACGRADCAAWTAMVEDKHSSVMLCPPAKASYEGDVTFSCLADGFWMLVTKPLTKYKKDFFHTAESRHNPQFDAILPLILYEQ